MMEEKEEAGGRTVNPNRPVSGSVYDCPVSHYLSTLLWSGINTDMVSTKEQETCAWLCVHRNVCE